MTPAKGIDSSMFNRDITHLVPQVDFAIVKASQGAYADGWYKHNSAAVLAGHKVLGAYLYAVYGPGPTRQARTFLLAASNAAFLVVDDEGFGPTGGLNHADTVRAIIANIHNLDPQKRNVGLYSSDGTWPGDLGQDFNWIADYVDAPGHPWKFWQYNDGGGKLDHDEYNGTPAALAAWAKTRRA